MKKSDRIKELVFKYLDVKFENLKYYEYNKIYWGKIHGCTFFLYRPFDGETIVRLENIDPISYMFNLTYAEIFVYIREYLVKHYPDLKSSGFSYI
jgi:hypothetical protein